MTQSSSKKTSAKKADTEEGVTGEDTPGKDLERNPDTQLPAGFEEIEDVADQGFEDVDDETFSIPFLSILQSNSPQVKRSESAYIKGAEEGMLVNTVTKELFDGDDGVDVIPLHYRRAFTKWTPRDDGGGFHGEYSVDEFKKLDTTRDGGKFVDGEGYEYVDTRYHYVIVVKADGSFEPALITMTSTQIPKSKNLMSRLKSIKLRGKRGRFTPPMYFNVVRIRTAAESNDQGTWMGFLIDDIRQIDTSNENELEAMREAQSFREQVRSGNVREDHEAAAETEGGDDEARGY